MPGALIRTHPARDSPSWTWVSGVTTPTTWDSRLGSARTLTHVWTVLSTQSATDGDGVVAGNVAALAVVTELTSATAGMGALGVGAGEERFVIGVESAAPAFDSAPGTCAVASTCVGVTGMVRVRPRIVHVPKAPPASATIVRPVQTNGAGRTPRAVVPHQRQLPRRRG